ncbi:hypothetical protein KEU06_25330 [Pseudaminobacter sp. 19-2017]|uniref:Uncharacterized protein n=1 Tax=Pseudaminobacter soli (ex Zhang et al. 2022) TaxID=2831468 RepID=A0A942I4S4_9HYPH|nr:hypothetical protein [Pseudaminobacter soli]
MIAYRQEALQPAPQHCQRDYAGRETSSPLNPTPRGILHGNPDGWFNWAEQGRYELTWTGRKAFGPWPVTPKCLVPAFAGAD